MRDTERRKRKLAELLDRLKRKTNVQNRDLRIWLGAEAFAQFESDCEAQRELREELREKPAAVEGYEQRLKRATLAYNKGEGASARGRHKAAQMHFRQADRLFERALEFLQEQVAADASLHGWFDRSVNWTADGDIALSPTAMPRVVTSRSLDNRGGGLASILQSKRELKIAAIERALAGDDASKGQAEEDARASLSRLLDSYEDDDGI